ncbi:hypothetical protein E2C01_011977 [Portunus trituberculatus]|uniref:Uncharacterized protein n=1 Tax=Portunus trituberculatus TaxID=210409 RepID=A0A5B7DCH6_PORTR|nr:hypothetical protein [Portunus trituberculatus]
MHLLPLLVVVLVVLPMVLMDFTEASGKPSNAEPGNIPARGGWSTWAPPLSMLGAPPLGWCPFPLHLKRLLQDKQSLFR